MPDAALYAQVEQFLLVDVMVSASLNLVLDKDQRESTPTIDTPIQHLVVIFDSNNSFDRYFAIYPYLTDNTAS